MLNSDSRSRSAVGRIACDFGAASARPRNRPPTMRISARAACPSPACGGGVVRARTGSGLLARDRRCRGGLRRASDGREFFFSGERECFARSSRFGSRCRCAADGSGALAFRCARLRLRLRLALHDRRGEIRARRLRQLLAELLAQHAASGPPRPRPPPARRAGTGRTTRGSAGSPAARDGPARCAPRGSCPRGSRT